MKTLTFLNSWVLTAFGTFEITPISIEDARRLIAEFVAEGKEVRSAIGHEPTAQYLSELFEHHLPFNRISFVQGIEDLAIAMKLRDRPPEGKILTIEALREMEIDLGCIRRIK
jgi:hypothetical protein